MVVCTSTSSHVGCRHYEHCMSDCDVETVLSSELLLSIHVACCQCRYRAGWGADSPPPAEKIWVRLTHMQIDPDSNSVVGPAILERQIYPPQRTQNEDGSGSCCDTALFIVQHIP